MRPILLGIIVVAAWGCKSKPQATHDDHEESHQENHEHENEVAPGNTALRSVRVDQEMLRDLRITTATTESRAAGERVTVLGELAVNQEAYAEVAAPMTARVVKVLVGAGDVVKAGQPLVELHSPELGKSRAEYQAAKSRHDQAQKALLRKKDLASEKLVTARELQEAEAAATTAESEQQVALAQLKSFGQISEAASDASRFVLRAPLAGTVIERSVVMGQLADPANTLFRIGDLSHLWLTAHVFERDAVRVKLGAKASVSFAALPGHPVEAAIAAVGREVEASSRTIPVRLDVPNTSGSLRPGMSATVALSLGDDTANVVAVPLASVQRVGEHWVVFLPGKEAGAFEIRPIGRGRELGGEVEVLSGLAAGEVIVVDGAFLLKAESDKARGEGGKHEH